MRKEKSNVIKIDFEANAQRQRLLKEIKDIEEHLKKLKKELLNQV